MAVTLYRPVITPEQSTTSPIRMATILHPENTHQSNTMTATTIISNIWITAQTAKDIIMGGKKSPAQGLRAKSLLCKLRRKHIANKLL